MGNDNVLFIMTDQQRADCVGVNDNPYIETPNLDWLAAQGVNFTNAYTPSPSCIPARAALLTGMAPWNTGILGMGAGQGQMGVGFSHTLPGELAKAGYQTQLVGEGHFYPQRSLNGFHNTLLDESDRAEDPQFTSDYKEWFNKHKDGEYDVVDHGINWNSWMARPYHAVEHLHPTNWTVNESIKFLQKRDPSKPFFLMTSFARPHSPYDPPSYYFDMYKDKELPKPYAGAWNDVYGPERKAIEPDAWRGIRSETETQRARAGYYGSITHIDQQIGRLLLYLQKCGQLHNTLIIFTSDHGDMLGDHQLWRKTYAYEGSARVPLIIKPPRELECKQKTVADAVVLQDIMPTILDIVDADIPETVDGLSLRGAIEGDMFPRTYIHGEHSACYAESQEMQYLTDGEYKYVWLPRLHEEQLFHIKEDRGESEDLAKDIAYNDVLVMWRKRMVDLLEKRQLGLTSGDELVSQAGKPPIVSPKYQERLERSSYKWM
ncbi:arylsulfatase [Bacillaceae bacterium SIJ1]|uniref:arylsulfatase n=1 Tax=Litoribacterium kuwaitense TaxID=1398745 RepID=UPI0013EC9FF9|nr:arylsulfatase [Litoribacterium kuwaitense]NGP45732.1 arylsulfatase [Litoribacterium kuwaitense]